VLQIAQYLEPALDDRMRLAPLDVHDEPDATGVVFEPRVVQALGLRRHEERSGLGHSANVLGAKHFSLMSIQKRNTMITSNP
jgi:hypothetical protein